MMVAKERELTEQTARSILWFTMFQLEETKKLVSEKQSEILLCERVNQN